jgi:NAD(P)H dehydrogenase (quinone)
MIEAAAPVALAAGRWQAASGNGRIPLVTRADCIAAAAEAMLASDAGNRIYNITGPEGLTYREVATILAENAGKPIEWVDCTAAQAYAEFDAMGIPRTAVPDQRVDSIPWSSDDMVSMQVGIADGWFDIDSNDFEHLTGRKPQSFRDYARLRSSELKAMAASANTPH